MSAPKFEISKNRLDMLARLTNPSTQDAYDLIDDLIDAHSYIDLLLGLLREVAMGYPEVSKKALERICDELP